MQQIKMHAIQMIWKRLGAEVLHAVECLIDQADETQAHAKKLLRRETQGKKKLEIS